jgi:uncharacterized membrane protein
MRAAPARKIYGRHLPFYAGIAAAVLCGVPAILMKPDFAIDIAAVVFFSCYLGRTIIRLPYLTAAYLEHHATDADEPVWIIFAVTFAAAAVSIGSLFVVLNRKGASGIELALAFASVALGWFTIHTMAALHYAHVYWRPSNTETGRGAGRSLSFPGDTKPGAFDFLYFAFVIGMTAQTSDVAITSTAMRKVNLLHAIASFFFNTVLVAAAVNAAVSLAT